jgi:hypothetical protein
LGAIKLGTRAALNMMRTDTSIQTSLFPIANQGLFSNNYIEKHLPTSPAWSQHDAKLETIFASVKEVYRAAAELKLGPGEEDQLRYTLITPVLELLGFECAVEPSSQRGGVPNRPDYALFLSHDEFVAARQGKNDVRSYYSHATTILEAKYWGRRLNDADSADKLDSRDPTAQLTGYLDDVYRASNGRVQWAILTNGKHWRLFYHHSDFRAGTYYQVDLEEVVRRGTVDDFKLFYLFFSRDAFIPDPQTGKSLLDAHRKGSVEYASAISNRLKELIFDEVFEGLAQGFLEYRRAEEGIAAETEASLAELHDSCMILLYRLIFLLFAESRNLLPVDHPGYRAKSLFRLREDVTHDLTITPFEKMSSRAYDYWSRFESLCNIIAKGDPSLNVPIYNGGLFEQNPDSFLATHKLADRYFTRALHALTSDHVPQGSEPSYYDYSSLSVRHLGDVYEGLLEFFVRVADQPMIEVREKGKVIWRPASGGSDFPVATSPGTKNQEPRTSKVVGERKPGEMYIENSNHERKVTGSYFTPPYIVEYIVKHAVGPVLDERLKQAEALMQGLRVLYARQRRALGVGKEWRHWEHPGKAKSKQMPEIQAKEEQLFETLFGIKALDLSMGSGHFLVRTVNVIADTLITFLARFDENPVIARIDQMRQQIITDVERQGVKIDVTRLTEVNLIKRMVMKRCIYGVDLNPMAVELAKLSLWLDSFTLGAPLSFLDHHLKCGNSLIGKDDISTAIVPGSQTAKQFQVALRSAGMVSRMSDSTAAEVSESRSLYQTMQQVLAPFKRRFDFRLSHEFSPTEFNSRSQVQIGQIEMAIQSGKLQTLSQSSQNDVAVSDATAAKHRFFHWRLEFPEVWYDENGEKQNPGFDVDVGNPPYGAHYDDFEARYLARRFRVSTGVKDVYAYFMERALALLRPAGLQSFIVPSAWLGGPDYVKLRELMLEQEIETIVLLPYDVFPDAYVDTAVFVASRRPASAKHYVRTYSYGKRERLSDISLADKAYGRVAQSDWSGVEGKKFVLAPDSVRLHKVIAEHTTLRFSDVIQMKRGVLFDLAHLTQRKTSECSYRYFEGDVYRYQLNMVAEQWIKYDDKMRERPKEFFWFEGRRILLRRLVNRQERLMSCLTDETFITNKNLYSVLPKEGATDIRAILGILNSRLVSHLYLSRVTQAVKDDFPQVTIADILALPFPDMKTDKAGHDKMVALVEKMLKLHKDLAKAKSQAKKDAIQSEVKETDQDIDSLVYELYGLTEDEIRIVEGERSEHPVEGAGRIATLGE